MEKAWHKQYVQLEIKKQWLVKDAAHKGSIISSCDFTLEKWEIKKVFLIRKEYRKLHK